MQAKDRRSYQTLEFWLSIVAFVVGAVISSGAVESEGILKILGLIMSMLSALGYTGFRSYQKVGLLKANALVAASNKPDPS